MLELFKVLVDILVFRDSTKKGMLNGRVILAGFGFAVLEYSIGLPAVLYYERHPQAKPLFLAAMALVLLNFAVFMAWALRWYFRQAASQRADS